MNKKSKKTATKLPKSKFDKDFQEALDSLKACYRCLTIDSDMEEDFAPEIKKAKAVLKKFKWQ